MDCLTVTKKLTETTPSDNSSGIREFEPKTRKEKQQWLDADFIPIFVCGFYAETIHEELYPILKNDFIKRPEFITIEDNSTSIDIDETIILPHKYGRFFTEIEEDKELIGFYENANFFEEKDFQE